MLLDYTFLHKGNNAVMTYIERKNYLEMQSIAVFENFELI